MAVGTIGVPNALLSSVEQVARRRAVGHQKAMMFCARQSERRDIDFGESAKMSRRALDLHAAQSLAMQPAREMSARE